MSTYQTAGKVRVLIAEDDAIITALTRSALESLGYTVVGTAPNGRKVVDMVCELEPTVVVMDIDMPLTDGIRASAAIQQIRPTPVVILTAHTDYANLLKATAAGVGAFIAKPPTAEVLEQAINVAIARHAELMEMSRLNHELKQGLAEMKTLSRLLPICAGCNMIRDDKGDWAQVDVYVMKRTEAKVTQTYCPGCLEKHFPGAARRRLERTGTQSPQPLRGGEST